ncbi:hypothetical protein [Halalkalibacter nanhaiisediminis]|uniref:Uncharacterized protein n=1 Tax=Halalkalibacter nanhaiisediminis TaxID=688079 RepID=A0A562QBJ2_9BACI|nr:hypothetical protein [Halalkalibacter nanhaiisediminis]TWI54127.1 hypothetical protein IQ10_03239 [Halalkalibacter nanhaiisediminis]
MSEARRHSHEELLTILEYIRDKAKEETRLEVAECMLDYGIDIKLVRAITGLRQNQVDK